jgi:hypothetical protein
MKKYPMLAVLLLGLGLAVGCATGGNGIIPPSPSVTVSTTAPTGTNPPNQGTIYPTQTVTLKADTTVPAFAPVTWSLSGPGAILSTTPPTATTDATATYQAPACVSQSVCIGSTQPTITATFTSNSLITGSLDITVVDITTEVTPASSTVGPGLVQQFTAVAVPDDAPQTFNWTCTANGGSCMTFQQDPNISGLAYYTADDSCGNNCVQISAVTPLDPSGCVPNPKNCTVAKASLVTSRVNGTYAFRFSGFDGSNNATAVVGTFTASNGNITSGTEEELTSGGWATHSISGGQYNAITASDPNSNNAGVLTLTTGGAFPNRFQVALDGVGDLKMIEIDGHGTGSGVAQKTNPSLFVGTTAQTFAFGLTGVDSSGKRVGFAGVLPMNGSGMIVSPAQVDENDNGTPTSYNSVTGAYTVDNTVSGLWHITNLALGSNKIDIDFFIASTSNTKSAPLTLYAISTDPIDSTHPAVSGTMVLQDSTQTYNNAAMKGTSVSALTGVNGANSNVSLTLGTTDGNGNFAGTFDQNNAGTIVTVPPAEPSGTTCAPPQVCSFANTYTAGSVTNGRYTLQMLGNPNASPVVAPLPFILYASGANRGFLIECNLQPPACGSNQNTDTSVMTGTMNPQGSGGGSFAPSELPGTYGGATTSSATPAVTPLAVNLLLTYPRGDNTYDISGVEYPGSATITGAKIPFNFGGTGLITLTSPAAQTYAIYAVDSTGCTKNSGPVCAILDFFLIDETTTDKDPSVIFAQQ